MASLKEDNEILEGAVITKEDLEEYKNEIAVNDPGYFVCELQKSFEWEGKTYESLTFNFSKLRGKDSLAIEDELRGKLIVMPALSEEYLIRMCARACEEPIGWDMIQELPISTYNRIIQAGKNFLALQK